jgi:hypothetical protein
MKNKAMNSSRRFKLLTCILVAIVAGEFVVAQPTVHAVPRAAERALPLASESNECRTLVDRAMELLESACDSTGRNGACYGNNLVNAEPVGETPLQFKVRGDKVPIKAVRALKTSPLNAEQGTWGISLLKLQANLPDTMPGQNVTFLVFGNTSVENTSGDMQAFYFTSGLGDPSCKEVSADGIIVKSPKHTEVTFTANGAQVTIASTVVLMATPNKSMSVELVEGSARVTTAAGSRTLQPGQITFVQLGGASGLEAQGAPSIPSMAYGNPSLNGISNAAGKFTGDPAPINVSFDGCITATKPGAVVIYDFTVVVNSKVLENAKVGECLSIQGNIHETANGFVITPSRASPSTAKALGRNKSKDKGNRGNPNPGNPGNGNGGDGKRGSKGAVNPNLVFFFAHPSQEAPLLVS